MLVIMTAFGQVWFADIPTTWIPGLAIGAIIYLIWRYFRATQQQRKAERERRRQRLVYWGNE